MTKRFQQAMIAVLTVGLMVSSVAEAKRFGGGRSSGMSRSYSSPSAANTPSPSYAPAPSARPSPPYGSPVQAQPAPRSGPGIGSMVAAGAAGAAAGYMLGKSNSEPQTAAPAPSSSGSWGTTAPAKPESGFPWGTLLLLGVVGFFAMRWMRRKTNGALAGTAHTADVRTKSGAPFTLDARPNAQEKTGMPTAASAQIFGGTPNGRLPDGTEEAAFLRQAKGTFLHLQTMNGETHIESLRAFLTPQLFNSIRDEVAQNKETADFPVLEVQLLGAAEEGMDYVASVRFSGQVSESPGAPTEPFTEVWHFIKPKGDSLTWKLAGIEQVQ